MLNFYENKGRKIFIGILIAIIVGLSVVLIVEKFDDINKDESVTSVKEIVKVEEPKQVFNGQMEYIEGSVEKRTGETGGWFEVTKSDIIRSGDEVRTLENSRAIVTLEDGSAVRLDENTTISFNKLVDNIDIGLTKGFIYNEVAKNNDREYSVISEGYTVTALGTEFSVENNGGEVDVMVIESAVEVKDKDEKTLEKIEEGNKASVGNSKVEKKEIEKKDLEDDFVAWNISKSDNEKVKKEIGKEDKEKEEKKEEEKKAYTPGTIKLSGEKSSSGVRLHWDTSGVNTGHGFKVVKSKEANPVYPGSDYKYLSDSGVRDYKWKIDTGKKYHFRVCTYLGNGKCGTYSNDVYVDTPDGDDDDGKDDNDAEYANNVSLSVDKDGDDAKLKWSISGGGAPKGFKVVKSKSKNPVYPGDDYKYVSDKDTRKYTWKDLSDDKTYYFRVCIYKGGKCGTYSNNVKVEM